MKGTNATYFGNVLEGITSSYAGIKLTLRHLFQAFKKRKPVGIADENYFSRQTGIVTLQYPTESFPVPDNGRYRLYNEIEDCIVCDLCAKICPVNCIEIEPVKATEEIGKTSDGTTKRIYAAKFDIDMAKCCYCGLCTTVCPTECLTMTKAYDYSEFDIRNMIYHFTDLSPEQAQGKKQLLESSPKGTKPKTAVANPDNAEQVTADPISSVIKPAFKPVIKTIPPKTAEEEDIKDKTPSATDGPVAKPSFKPVIKRPASAKDLSTETSKDKAEDHNHVPEVTNTEISKTPQNANKPVFKPVIKMPATVKDSKNEPINEAENLDKNEIKKIQEKGTSNTENPTISNEIKKPLVKPVFKPVIKSAEIKKQELPVDKSNELEESASLKEDSKNSAENTPKEFIIENDEVGSDDQHAPIQTVTRNEIESTTESKQPEELNEGGTKKAAPFKPVIKSFKPKKSSDEANSGEDS